MVVDDRCVLVVVVVCYCYSVRGSFRVSGGCVLSEIVMVMVMVVVVVVVLELWVVVLMEGVVAVLVMVV